MLNLRNTTDQVLHQPSVSRNAAKLWSSLDPSDRQPFHNRAEAERRSHALKYPGYRFQPRSTKASKRLSSSSLSPPLVSEGSPVSTASGRTRESGSPSFKPNSY